MKNQIPEKYSKNDPRGGGKMTLIFDVFCRYFVQVGKNASQNVFFKRFIFDDFLDGPKSRSQDEKNH